MPRLWPGLAPHPLALSVSTPTLAAYWLYPSAPWRMKPLFLHVGRVKEEVDQSDLPLCLATLVPTDPEVGPLGEDVFVLCLTHHLLSLGIHDVGGHLCLWEKSAPCTLTPRRLRPSLY